MRGAKMKKVKYLNKTIAYTVSKARIKNIYISIQNQYLERAVDVLCDIFYNSKFSHTEFIKEREVIIDEINSYKEILSEEFYWEENKNITLNNSSNILHIGRQTISGPITVNDSNNVTLLGPGVVPNLSNFWNKLKFCYNILFKY